jgi:hypothetical protein
MRRIRQHLSYANVISTLCLFLLLGSGSALAAVVITSNSQVAKGTISGHKPPAGKHANLIAGSVNGTDVANESLTGADIENRSGVDTCVNTVRIGQLCVRAENFHRNWYDARNHCANLDLRIPTLGEAIELVRTHDVPNVDESEDFWTDEISGDPTTANGQRAYAVSDDSAVNSNVSLADADIETVCVTTPTN